MDNERKRGARTEPPIGRADDPEQSARFIEAARELGIEEVGEAYERGLDRILSAPKPTGPVPPPTAEPKLGKRTRGRPKSRA